jgi:hypothetical protein
MTDKNIFPTLLHFISQVQKTFLFHLFLLQESSPGKFLPFDNTKDSGPLLSWSHGKGDKLTS